MKGRVEDRIRTVNGISIHSEIYSLITNAVKVNRDPMLDVLSCMLPPFQVFRKRDLLQDVLPIIGMSFTPAIWYPLLVHLFENSVKHFCLAFNYSDTFQKLDLKNMLQMISLFLSNFEKIVACPCAKLTFFELMCSFQPLTVSFLRSNIL